MTTRRDVLTSAAAIPGVLAIGAGVPMAAYATKLDPLERIRRAIQELEAAMLAAYDGESRMVSWGPHNPDDAGDRSRGVFVVVHPRGSAS